jgi:hypothetical protein
MRVFVFLIGLTILCGCVTNDSVEDRVYGQQLVCHKGHTQAVSTADSFVHQNHGDKLGPCPEEQ